MKKHCLAGEFNDATNIVRDRGLRWLDERCVTHDHESILIHAIRGCHLDVANWYFDAFVVDEYLGAWADQMAGELTAHAFHSADRDNLERCEAAEDWVAEKFQLNAYDETAERRFPALISAETEKEPLGLAWLARKIGEAEIYGRLDSLELDCAHELFDKIKHVPQLQVIADYLRMSIAAREKRAVAALPASKLAETAETAVPVESAGLAESVGRVKLVGLAESAGHVEAATPADAARPVGRVMPTALNAALRHTIALQYDLPVDWLTERVRELVAKCEAFEQN